MFADEARKIAMDWNHKRCKDPKKLLKRVKKELLWMAKRPELHTEAGFVTYYSVERLSQEGFKELQRLCREEGIVFTTDWKNVYPATYSFAIKVR